jgi:hypothetical protein
MLEFYRVVSIVSNRNNVESATIKTSWRRLPTATPFDMFSYSIDSPCPTLFRFHFQKFRVVFVLPAVDIRCL